MTVPEPSLTDWVAMAAEMYDEQMAGPTEAVDFLSEVAEVSRPRAAFLLLDEARRRADTHVQTIHIDDDWQE
jgi:hypothetical protein